MKKLFLILFSLSFLCSIAFADCTVVVGQTVASGGGGSEASVLDVTFEGASEAARLKNLVDDSDPTTADGATTATLPYAGTYSYDTGGSSNELIYAISGFSITDTKITFAWKMPSYAGGDYVMDLFIDANNRIYIITGAANVINAVIIAGGTQRDLTGTTLVNDGAWHTVELSISGTDATYKVDGNTDDTTTVVGSWTGTLSSANWGIENDNTSGCDCIFDNIKMDTN